MPDWIATQELPTPDEYNRLRASVGWRTFAEAQSLAALRASIYCVCVRQGGELVGMGRVVGDGAVYFYLQDVIVPPDLQRRGIGTAIVEKLLQYVSDSAAPGTFVGLFAADGAAQFYESFGFVRRNSERPGMQWICP